MKFVAGQARVMFDKTVPGPVSGSVPGRVPTIERNTRKGQMGFVTLFFIALVALAAIYWFYGYYNKRYYISCYDGEMTRYLEVPPYTTRKTLVDEELIGRCAMEVGVSQDQVNTFLSSMCQRKGFQFRTKTDGLEIEISPQYIVRGTYSQTTLSLLWKPKLTEKLLKKITPELASKAISLATPSMTLRQKN